MLKIFANFVIKNRWILLAVILAITAFFAYQMKNLYYDNRLTHWLPKGDPVLELLIETGDKFGPNELVMVMVKSREKESFSSQLLESIKSLTDELKENENIFFVTSITNMPDIAKIEGGIQVNDFLDEIPVDKEKLKELRSYALSKENYVNNVISPDGKWLALAVYIKSNGDPIEIFKNVVKPTVKKHLEENEEIFYSGIPSDAYYAEKFISSDLKRLVAAIIILILLVLYFSFKNFKGVLFPTLVVLVSSLWVFGFMGLIRWPMTLITPALPVLLVALGSAYGIHVVNKIFYEIRTVGLRFSRLKIALAGIVVPVLMAGMTTVAGFASFATVRLKIIKDFGLLAAVGIIFAIIISLTLIPTTYAVLPRKENPQRHKDQSYSSFLNFLSRLVRKYKIFIPFIALVIIVVFITGIPKIQREVNFTEYYPKTSQPRLAFNITKDHFGGAYPLTLYFESENIKSASALRIIRRAENFIYSLEGISKPFSIADLIQEMNFVLNGRFHIPENDRGVGNLWFFIEGRDELSQLITEDLKETLVFSKASTSATKFMQAIQARVEEFLDKEFSQDLSEFNLANLSEVERNKLRKEEAAYVLEEISWMIHSYGEGNFDIGKSKEGLFGLIDEMPHPADDDLKGRIEQEFRSYVFSEYFDFEVSERIKEKLFASLMESVSKGHSSQEDFEAILSKSIPTSEYDEEITSYVASTLVIRIEEALRMTFAQRACDSLKGVFPEEAEQDQNFCKKRFGLFYEIADHLVVLPSSQVKGIQGKEVKFDKIEQSGYPAAMTRLDHFLYVSQIQSLLLALIVTFILMILMRRSFVLGSISIIPIVFTVSVIYGFLGFTGIRLDFATMMTASVSIGVGIDYSIHFIHSALKNMDKGYALEEAIHHAFLEKGKAILTNSIAVIAGFVVLLLSSMSPLRDFGGIMAGSMFLAALSSLTVLPAMILITKPKLGRKK